MLLFASPNKISSSDEPNERAKIMRVVSGNVLRVFEEVISNEQQRRREWGQYADEAAMASQEVGRQQQ